MRRLLVFVLFLAPLAARAAVTGRVIDADGKPLAGIRVRAFARETPEVMFARFLAATPERRPVGSAQTKADGSFSVDARSHGVVDLILDDASREPVIVEVVDGEDAGAFVLRPAKKVRGRITAGGKGVANATVIVAGDIVVRTGEDGSFEIVPPSLTSRGGFVVVVHPDYAPAMDPPGRDRKAPYDVELRAGVALSGRVLAADGKTPVAGATVRANHWPLAKSSDDGTYRIAHAPPFEVLSAIDGSRVGRTTFDKRVASHDIVLRAGGSISGTLRSSKDDTPIAGARVSISSPGVFTQPSAITDAKGNFTIAPVAPTSGSLFMQHLAFSGDSTPVEVIEGARVTRNLSAMPLARIRGSVVDEQRRPVAAARAMLTMSSASATTGPDGTFLLRVPPVSRFSQPMSVVVGRSGYATESAGPFALQPGELKSVQISLRRGFRFEVQVVDREGRPIANEPVALTRWTDPDDVQSRVSMVCSEADPVLCQVTDESGRRVYELLDGKYDVMAGGRTTPLKTLGQQMLDARSKPLVIELERGLVVEGRVLGADDQPVEGATVSTANRSSITQSDATGAFAFRNLAAGATVTLAAETRAGLFTDPVSVTAPAGDVILRLPRPARIEGRVFDRESKQPVRDFSISVVRERRQFGMSPVKKFTSEDGRFVLDEIAPGKVDLNVLAKGYAPGSMVDVPAAGGATATVEIALDRGGTVTGRVSSGGTPVPDVAISLAMMSNRGGMPPQVRTDTSGEFTIDGVPAGTQSLSLRKNGYVPKTTAVEVTAGRESRANVELERGRTLEGRVVDSAGRGLPLAEVSFRNAPMSSARTDADGAFRVEGLGDQSYTVTARKDGYLQAELEVNPAQNASVTITLGRGGSISGRVVGVTETDLSSIHVSASGDRGWRSTTPPDASGNFTIQGVPDGRAEIRAVQMRPTRRQSEPKVIEVTNGSGPFVQLDFTGGIVVRGRVTREGKPVEGAVTFSPANPAQRGLTNTWTELVAGAYEVRLAEPGEYMVRVQQMYGQVRTSAPQKINVTSAMTHDIEIRGATLRGRVLDERTGAPIAGAMVEVSSPGWGTNATSDSDGRFSLDSLNDATYRVTASRERFVAEPREVVISGGSDAEVEVRLRQGESIGVRVVDAADGRALNAAITPRVKGAKGSSAPHGRPASLENGMQRLWLLPGTYSADVWVQGYVPRTVDLQVPGPDIHVMLERGGTVIVQGRVSGAVFVRLRAGEKRYPTSVGSGRMENVPAGTYALEAVDDKQKVLATKEGIVVTAGQTTTVTWE